MFKIIKENEENYLPFTSSEIMTGNDNYATFKEIKSDYEGFPDDENVCLEISKFLGCPENNIVSVSEDTVNDADSIDDLINKSNKVKSGNLVDLYSYNDIKFVEDLTAGIQVLWFDKKYLND